MCFSTFCIVRFSEIGAHSEWGHLYGLFFKIFNCEESDLFWSNFVVVNPPVDT